MPDALVKTLNGLGYQPIFLPRTGVKPPELYNADRGRLFRRRPLADKLPSTAKLQLTIGRLPSIEHAESSSKSLKAAGSFLNNALQCLAITEAPRIDLGFAGG